MSRSVRLGIRILLYLYILPVSRTPKQSSLLTPQSSLLTHQSSLLTPQNSSLIRHSSLQIPHVRAVY